MLATGDAPFPPNIAVMALSVINYWSQIDAQMAELLAKIMRAEPRSAMAMYGAVKSADARREMTIAAAKEVLDRDTHALIRATVESCKASKRQRNSIAHDLWGTLNDGSGLLICVDAQVMAAFNGSMEYFAAKSLENALAQHTGGTFRPIEMPRQLDREKVMTWKEDDFRDASSLAKDCLSKIARLPFLVNPSPLSSMRQKLLADPQIERLHSKYLENTP